eukprot:50062-Pyramimonas_sp.AAC.1
MFHPLACSNPLNASDSIALTRDVARRSSSSSDIWLLDDALKLSEIFHPTTSTDASAFVRSAVEYASLQTAT